MTSQQRISDVLGDIFATVNERLVKHQVGYEEYRAAKDWLIRLGEAGEWPLFLDVFFEHTVENIAAEKSASSESSIEGPYYVPGARELDSPCTLPMRADEPGDRLVFSGVVRDTRGEPLPHSTVDMWQADSHGFYSHFHPDPPDGNLRARVRTDGDGRFRITTVVPAPYEIPKDGPTGQMITAAGWHHWRPAHLHLKVGATGKEPLTTQLFFSGGKWLDTDIASAVKPGLVLDLDRHEEAGQTHYSAAYDFELEPARG